MSSHESGGEHEVERPNAHRARVAVAISSIAIVGTFIAYTAATQTYEAGSHLPKRNAPTEQHEYALNVDDAYYKKIADTKHYTDNPETTRRIDALTQQPVAEWLLDDSPETFATLKQTLGESAAANTIPVLVAYDIPDRDLGSHSAGGEEDAQRYREWIGKVSDAIANHAAVVILEPDALAQLPDMSKDKARERVELLADALDTLHSNQNTAVYLDVGNSAWLEPADVAMFIKHVADKSNSGVAGIALNVSNFRPKAETEAYAEAIQDAYGGPLYLMIDTSRNGAEPPISKDEWCNPEGHRLGEADPSFKPSAQVETAFIKAPGESDGRCGISSLGAGAFDSTLLLEQLKD